MKKANGAPTAPSVLRVGYTVPATAVVLLLALEPVSVVLDTPLQIVLLVQQDIGVQPVLNVVPVLDTAVAMAVALAVAPVPVSVLLRTPLLLMVLIVRNAHRVSLEMIVLNVKFLVEFMGNVQMVLQVMVRVAVI